jgi:hypothetical protein
MTCARELLGPAVAGSPPNGQFDWARAHGDGDCGFDAGVNEPSSRNPISEERAMLTPVLRAHESPWRGSRTCRSGTDVPRASARSTTARVSGREFVIGDDHFVAYTIGLLPHERVDDQLENRPADCGWEWRSRDRVTEGHGGSLRLLCHSGRSQLARGRRGTRHYTYAGMEVRAAVKPGYVHASERLRAMTRNPTVPVCSTSPFRSRNSPPMFS